MYNLGTPIESGEWDFTVRKEVIEHLSVGLYRNFSRTIKELISNSYDAGATQVNIELDTTRKIMTIYDNGEGMNSDELKSFIDIGKSTGIKQYLIEQGRRKIGRFGIGVLSVFPYAKTVRVITKKRQTDTVYEMIIDTSQFFIDERFVYIEDAKAEYNLYSSEIDTLEGETTIILEELADHIIEELNVKTGRTSSIESKSGIDKFKWYLSQYSPIEFKNSFILKNYFKNSNTVPMDVFVLGEKLYRNTPNNLTVLEKGEMNTSGVEIKYCIATSMEPVRPNELRGIQVRLDDVGIGLPRDFDVIRLKGRVLGKLNWIWGELHVLSGLEDALMVDRDNFFYTERYNEVQKEFQKKLIHWNNYLDELSKKEKIVYETLDEIGATEEIEEELKEAGVLKLKRKRMRISSDSIVRKKSEKIQPYIENVAEIIEDNTNYQVEISEEENEIPITLVPESKKAILYKTHEKFSEKMEYQDIYYEVIYSSWETNEKPSMCKIENTKVYYNTQHPIFKGKLNINIVKKMLLVFNVLVYNINTKSELTEKFENILYNLFSDE